MATFSSILACKIPWTEKPDGLESMRSQRLRHDWATEHTYIIKNGPKYNNDNDDDDANNNNNDAGSYH